MPEIGNRIQRRLDELGISQAELARRCGLAQSTVNGLINGRNRSSVHLYEIARELGVSTAWLAGGSALALAGDAAESKELFADQLEADLLPMVDLSLLGEKGEFRVLNHVPVSRVWLREIVAESTDVIVGRNEGDGMAPTIAHNDIVVIDRHELGIRQQDSVWALRYAGLSTIRRVRRLPDGSYQLLSDNPAIQPIAANENEFQVIGRVAAIVKRV